MKQCAQYGYRNHITKDAKSGPSSQCATLGFERTTPRKLVRSIRDPHGPTAMMSIPMHGLVRLCLSQAQAWPTIVQGQGKYKYPNKASCSLRSVVVDNCWWLVNNRELQARILHVHQLSGRGVYINSNSRPWSTSAGLVIKLQHLGLLTTCSCTRQRAHDQPGAPMSMSLSTR